MCVSSGRMLARLIVLIRALRPCSVTKYIFDLMFIRADVT